MIWCLRSSKEAIKGRHHQHISRLSELFLLMVLYAKREILKSSRVYNSNYDGGDPEMNISLTYNSVSEWMNTFLPIMSRWRAALVIVEG